MWTVLLAMIYYGLGSLGEVGAEEEPPKPNNGVLMNWRARIPRGQAPGALQGKLGKFAQPPAMS